MEHLKISSWGQLSNDEHQIVSFSDRSKVADVISNSPTGIAFGAGRSYGDVCLNDGGTLWVTTGLDRLISFDEETGRLICESGVLLGDIQRLMIPRGWMLPVTPGTQFVTIGGAIANDVHGKNHHRSGSFGDHVLALRLVRTDGEIIDCGPNNKPDWFSATVGGMGLTGVISHAEIQLRPVSGPWIDSETVPFKSLSEFFSLSVESENKWEATVSWIDTISKKGEKGLFMQGNPAEVADKKEPKLRRLTFPFVPPISLVNPLSLRLFNWGYFHMNKLKAGPSVVHYQSFFYPLDSILHWNRIYGRKGFFQYQSVVPKADGEAVIKEMLNEISNAGGGSFLSVLKTFGERESIGMMSFPMPGVTLALDFPNRGEQTHKLFDRLDAIVAAAGGRLYVAKDARMPRELFEAGYPRLNEFLKYRDPGISSELSRRLMGS